MKYRHLINIGLLRLDITHTLDSMVKNADFRFKIFDRLNELGEYEKDEHLAESKKAYEKLVLGEIKTINKSIDEYNEVVKKLHFDVKLSKIDTKPVKREIEDAFRKNAEGLDEYKAISPYLRGRMIDALVNPAIRVLDELIEHKKTIDGFDRKFDIKSYPYIYQEDIKQLIDIYIMGYKSTALLVLGRIFEKIFMNLGYVLIDEKDLQITKKQLKEMKFEKVLEMFRDNNIISFKDWHILSKLRLDRNIGGHYLSEKDALLRSELEQEAEMTIMLALPLIKKYDKKINKSDE